MASLIGGATYSCGGTFSTGDAKSSSVIIEIIGDGKTKMQPGFLAQSVSASITKQDRTVFEVGSNYYYRIMGRPSGQGSVSHLVGPNNKPAWSSLASWSGCNPCSLKVHVKKTPGCPDTKSKGAGPVYFNGGFLNSVQVSATAGEVMVTSALGFTFMDFSSSLET